MTDSLCIHGVATLEREPASPAQVVARFARCWLGNLGLLSLMLRSGAGVESGLLLTIKRLIGPACLASRQQCR